ncbi:DUF4160 domain-containing protein [Paraburkholderia sacchari]|uniref:DUF4160 domain-containing protein n=1 Tax=Paraburkholderia sacchari TaxID=159450 RepID=UPI0039A6C3C0
MNVCPTIIRVLGFRVQIFTLDHSPPHVHVEQAEVSVVFTLNCPNGPLNVREIRGRISDRQVTRLADAIELEIARLCNEWRKIHG